MTADTSTSSSAATRVAAVRARIIAACERAGRDPAEVRLVAVSKTHTVHAVRAVLEAGVADFGENRAQELVPKAREAEAAGLTPEWHFIGHLQRNKVRDVLPYVGVLHSVDSTRLIEEIARRRPEAVAGHGDDHADGALSCYIEVTVAGEAQKQGVAPNELPALLAAAAGCPEIRVSGLMTVAPQVEDPEAVRPVFRALRELAHAHGLEGLSMGMTDDFEVAIEEGATVVRVGRALFGARNG
jgi:PLP dependent protein